MVLWPLPRINIRELSLVEETRPVALLTTSEVWAVLSRHLALPVMIQAEPARYDRDLFAFLAANLPSQVRVVYAVGSGAPLEAAKVIAAQNRVPLVIVPTALDSAAPLLPTALALETVADRQRVAVIETGPATEIIIDWGVIQAAAPDRRGAGIADVLSIVTGLLDWRYAAQHGKNPRELRFISWAAGVATALAKEAIKSAAAIGQGHVEALHTLLSLLATAVQLNNQLGHARAQQGAEHYLAQILAGITDFRVPHAALVGQCLIFAAHLHGQDTTPLREALAQGGVPLDLIRPTDFALALHHLPAHLADYGFPYSILNDLDLASPAVQEALETADLQVPPETWAQPVELAGFSEADAMLSDLALDLSAAGQVTFAESEPEGLHAPDDSAAPEQDAHLSGEQPSG